MTNKSIAQQSEIKLLGVVRVSKQDLAEGYGPAIQEGELVADATTSGYRLITSRHIVEPATINLEDRQLFLQVITEAINLKKSGQSDGLCFSRCDRLSRQFDAALQVALDCRKHGLTLRFVRENQWLHPDDEPIQFVMFILQAFGVHAQTRVSLANLKAGQHRAAAAGKLPAGVGPGLLGYTLVNKKFKPNSFITVCDEVLERGYKGDSFNQITRDLQSRDIRTPSGQLITRSTVARILRTAKRYAGIWDWGGHEIRGLIPPRISEQKAEAILSNLKRNRERSYGFGKRKWLTGRVICGICTRKFSLQEKRYCHCTRSEPLEANPPCPNVRIRWQKLSEAVKFLLYGNLMNLDVLSGELEKQRSIWQEHRANIEGQTEDLKIQVERLQEQRRKFLWQHSEGLMTDEELVTAVKGVRADADLLDKRLADLQKFLDKPEPPDPAKIERWAREYWPLVVGAILQQDDDERWARLSEEIDLTVVILPVDTRESYRLELSANIPLEFRGMTETSDTVQMVLASPPCQNGQRC